MGYITDFEVEISNVESEGQAREIMSKLDLLVDYDYLAGNLSFVLSSKWYDWERDLKIISKSYPNILIEVHGKGEDYYGDIWKARIRNGISEIIGAKVVFDDFKVIV